MEEPTPAPVHDPQPAPPPPPPPPTTTTTTTTTETPITEPIQEPQKQPPSSAPSQAPQAPPPPQKVPNKKRTLDERIEKSSYYKMRVILKEIRPHLLETLRAKDYRSCNGAVELREKLKLMTELNKQMTGTFKSKDVPEVKLYSGQNGSGRKPQEQFHEVKPAELPNYAKPSGNRTYQSITGMRPPAETSEIHGSYIVGGSAFGWNFITYVGKQPVYYGRTKEAFRASK